MNVKRRGGNGTAGDLVRQHMTEIEACTWKNGVARVSRVDRVLKNHVTDRPLINFKEAEKIFNGYRLENIPGVWAVMQYIYVYNYPLSPCTQHFYTKY